MLLTENHSYIIQNIELWTASSVIKRADLHVVDGKLESIALPGEISASCDQIIDGSNKVLMPAGVDAQVHLRVPGQAEKETALTGLRAAIKGGIGCILTMPNTKPVIDHPEVVRHTMQELASAMGITGVLVGIAAAITSGQRGQKPSPMFELFESGVWAFTDDGLGVLRDDIMNEAFYVSHETGAPILQHAEMPGHGGILAESSIQKQLGIKAYPASAEYEMVKRDIELLKKFPKARYHVLHVSSQRTLEIVEQAKNEGLQVSCEVSPHHLYFCADDIAANNTSFKMNPPLRSHIDRAALQKALASGVCDFVATDHAPHEQKLKGLRFETAAFGTTGLETSLRVLLTLKTMGLLTAERLVSVFSTKPALFLKLDKSFGDIQIGQIFRAVLCDINLKKQVTWDDLQSQSTNNCFIGQTLTGLPLYTFIGEKIWKLT